MRLLDRLLEDPQDIDLVVRRFRRAALGAWLGFPVAMLAVLTLGAARVSESGIFLPLLAGGGVYSLLSALQALDLQQAYHRLRLRAEFEHVRAGAEDGVPQASSAA